MTEQELDALVRKLEAQAYQQGRIARHAMLDAKSAITTLRAQLADANARADRAGADARSLKAAIFGSENYAPALKCGNFVEMVQALHAAQKGGLARAERAEAERAAQIEADAGIADDHTQEKHSGMTLQAHVTGRNIAAAIRAQPHDRTALDAAIWAAKVEVVAMAFDECMHGRTDPHQMQANLLALIEREGV